MKRKPPAATDEVLVALLAALDMSKAAYPRAVVDAYRFGPYSLKVRVVDPGFARVDRCDRDEPSVRCWMAFLRTC